MTDKVKDRFILNVFYNGNFKKLFASEGEDLLTVLNREDDISLSAPCGGKGRCGKCKVKIEADTLPPLTSEEEKLLSKEEIGSGTRLACMTRVNQDLTVHLEKEVEHIEIQEKGIEFEVELNPPIKKIYLTLPKPTLTDQRDELTRIENGLGQKITISLSNISSLPKLLREAEYAVTMTLADHQFIRIEKGDKRHQNFAIAVDIGTTTVVAYLLDLHKGRKVDVVSGLNDQKPYGQDVISRINHTIQHSDGLTTLNRRIINQINGMIDTLLSKNDLERCDIHGTTLVGNTTMIHLAAQTSPEYIASSPFIPAFTRSMAIKAKDLNLQICENGIAYILPSISGYIGADITSGILSSGMNDKSELALLIDIGTNGEIVLGNKTKLYCCSTAAGPAFEGAHIHHGVGGIAGAINQVSYIGSEFSYTTIADEHPIGICGSGIVDALAIFLRLGLVDETGRICDPDELNPEVRSNWEENMIKVNGEKAIQLPQTESHHFTHPLYMTQKDIREIQLAKAAIAAGIRTLIKKAEKDLEDIQKIYLAGGFGSYINRESAIQIGLLPSQLKDRIYTIGNAAGTGAIMALFSRGRMREAQLISKKATYIELSSTPEFQDAYIDMMSFEVQQ